MHTLQSQAPRSVTGSRVPGHARGARVLQDMGRPVGRRGREEERMRWRRRAHVLPVKVGRGWHYLRSHGKSGFERVESRESSGAKRRRRTVQRGVEEEERQLDSDSQRAVRVADNGSCIARVGNRYRVPISNSPWRFPVEERGELKACSRRCSSKSSAARGRVGEPALALCHSRDPQNARPLSSEYSLYTPVPDHPPPD